MSKSTHFGTATVTNELRIGGTSVGVAGRGGQPVAAARVPTNWYPTNLPAATLGAPQNSDCLALIGALAKLVPLLAIQQSVILANSYRVVQSAVVAGGTFSVNAIASPATTSWFDQNISVKEIVPIDVVNKNPTLLFDLAMRLAIKTGAQCDKQLAALYASLTIASVGASGTTPTAANLTTQINLVPNTGEPIIGFFNPATLAAYLAANPSQTLSNGSLPVVTPSGANKAIRLLASDQIAVATSNKNFVATPSTFVFASADQGLSTGSGGGIAPSGTLSVIGGTYRDPETATPQLTLQFVIGNTGSGVQTVYVNCLGAAICINPGNGGLVLS
jgi:hypothetical protein